MFIPIRRSDTWLFYFCLMLMGILSSPVIAYNTADPPTKGKMKIIRRSSPYRGAKLTIPGNYRRLLHLGSITTNQFQIYDQSNIYHLRIRQQPKPYKFWYGCTSKRQFSKRCSVVTKPVWIYIWQIPIQLPTVLLILRHCLCYSRDQHLAIQS